MLSNIRQSLSPTEIRALAANKVAAPTLKVSTQITSLLAHADLFVKILLELEANFKQTDMPGSFADSILMGVITDYRGYSTVPKFVPNLVNRPIFRFIPANRDPESDYVGTLLRDQTASHVLQPSLSTPHHTPLITYGKRTLLGNWPGSLSILSPISS